MASLLQFFPILHLPFIFICCTALKPILQTYIVYMGSSLNGNGGEDLSYLALLSSLIPREESERISLFHSYNHAFKGFSAILTEKEASTLSGYEEVVSVFPDPVLKLHTTRSWDFLEAVDNKFRSSRLWDENKSSEIIIGFIDTGIWPESPSFSDEGIGKIPSKWKGVCMEGSNFKKSNCNRKLIGARFYNKNGQASTRDNIGHGTHVASIAVGVPVANASYYGLARGTARGGLASARIASYKACSMDGCSGSVILKAIDDAIKDGVDIISISIGMSAILQSDFLSDPIAIGAFHAEQRGIMVVCSAGNDGPDPYTIVNTAPWIFTVAASTIDRNFLTTIVLGNNQSYEGTAINFSPLTRGKAYPLAFGEKVASRFTPASDARNCIPGSIDTKKAAGKIIVCVNEDPNVSKRIKKLVVEDAKAKGVIIIDNQGQFLPFDSGTYPSAVIGETTGSRILNYIKSTKSPTATILPTKVVPRFKPAPVVAPFSSRGPGGLTENILKPDIMAPGVAILAAIVPRIIADYSAPGNKTSLFSIKSGTSMACPHVTGAAAFIKSKHPHWTSSIIKSALMTTASVSNNKGKLLTNSTDYYASPHEAGVGEITHLRALDPGLVFETTVQDYLYFLCYFGYKPKTLRSITNTNFSCPKSSTEKLISNINYPTISIASLKKNERIRKIKRVVTNVGSSNATYTCSVDAPPGLKVLVLPKMLHFSAGLSRAAFKTFFDGKEATKGYNYGVIKWLDGLHVVRVVFAVNVE
ncbi:CO(2)-response secreted protease [Abeliophyllum distichum]|uniref:CO(2)-response secreted protease n=1 Tax=Abeliophyllum distichum TaxID=126358 RepID=A0ABD1NWK9_9LAMI